MEIHFSAWEADIPLTHCSEHGDSLNQRCLILDLVVLFVFQKLSLRLSDLALINFSYKIVVTEFLDLSRNSLLTKMRSPSNQRCGHKLNNSWLNSNKACLLLHRPERIPSNNFGGHGCLSCIDQALSAQIICPNSEIFIDVAYCLPGKRKKLCLRN